MLTFRVDLRRLVLQLILVLVFSHSALSQVAHADVLDRVRFQHLGPDDGLANDYVGGTFRDSRGFLWLATRNGLNRYDGMEFLRYQHDPTDPYSLGSDDVENILEDTQGDLWISTRGSGLNRFNFATERFTRYQHEPDNPDSLSHNTIISMNVDRHGQLWIATLGGGVNRLKPGSKSFIRYTHDPADPNSLSNNSVSYVCNDPSDNIWVSSYFAGFSRLDPTTGKFTHYRHKPNDPNSPLNDSIVTMHCAPDGMLWLSTSFGLSQFDPATEQFTHYRHDLNNPNGLSTGVTTSIITDNQGRLWMAVAGAGVSRFDPVTKRFTHYRHDPRDPYSVSSNYTMHIQEDSSGMLWISSYDRVSYTSLTNPRFTNYEYNPLLPNTLSYPIITSITGSQAGDTVWMGIIDGGLNKLERATGKITHYQHDSENPNSLSAPRVMSVHTAADDTVWVGSNNGLNHFDPVTERFTRYFEAPGREATDIHGLDIDSKGRIWFTGVTLRGLFRFDPTTSEPYELLRNLNIAFFDNVDSLLTYRVEPGNPNSPGSTLMQSVMVDSHDNVWVGSTDNGISYLDTQTSQFTHYVADNKPGSLSSNKISVIYEARDGSIWVATGKGLNQLDKSTKTFRVYQNEHGLPSDDVVSIMEDISGYLWLGTTKGIARFDRANGTFRNFDRFDGLQGNSFFRDAVHRMPDGQMLFGGRKGLSSFYPEQLTDNPHKPPVFITGFQLFNEPVPVGGDSPLQQAIGATHQITLTHEQSVFSFKFAALNLLHPVKNQYAYKLHGFDSNWTYTDSSDRSATYTNLDAGEYTFQVKASNNDGVWNNEGVSVELIILPPWWETLWFRASVIMAIALLITGGVRWRLHAMAVQQRKLEAQVDERTRELSKSNAELNERTNDLDIANQAINALNEQLKSENLRMGAELDVSKRMQQMLLPSPEELSKIEDLDIAVFMEPADEVGGDYYDVMAENNRVTIAIGDVTGHGLESGVMMILVQAGVHTLLADGAHEPTHFIRTLNRMVHGNVKRMDSDKNLTLMLLDYQDGQVRFSGQHEEVLWVSQDGTVQRIDTLDLGFMVGIEHNIEHFTAHEERELLPGEGIVLYTDGITEAMGPDKLQYGVERLCEIITRHWHEPSEKVQQAIIQDVLSHLGDCKPMDDLTLVVVKRRDSANNAIPQLTAAG